MLLKHLIVKTLNADGQPIKISTENTLVLVGPNNSGKSLTLREIESFLKNGNSSVNQIVEYIDISIPNNEDVAAELVTSRKINLPGNIPTEGSFFAGKINYLTKSSEPIFSYNAKAFPSYITYLQSYDYRRILAYTHVLRLDGSTRLNSLNESGASDLQSEAIDINTLIIKNKIGREEIRKIVFNAFGLYISTDVTGRITTRIRFSRQEPNENIETSLSSEAQAYHATSKKYEDVGDGLKAFSGILSSIVLSSDKIMLIDEPEAFLHPPLSYRLGELVSNIGLNRGINLIFATHSASFLMGVIQSGTKVTIARLTYNNDVSGVKIIEQDEVNQLFQNPVMRSANVIDGLFHDGVIITEDDSDRVLYQEINYRLVKHCKKGLDGALFLNSNGKSALHKIAGPLRKAGVPTAICADFDLFFEAADFGSILLAANVPLITSNSLKSQKSGLLAEISESDRSKIKSLGVNYFKGEKKEAAVEFVSRLAKYGIFIIPNGELESWLPSLDVSGQKVGRVIQILEKMGGEPTEATYVMPGEDDIWKYIEDVTAWLKNPNRQGM